MKRFILKIVSLLILIAGINLLYLRLIQKVDWNFKKRIEAQNLKNPKYDYIQLLRCITFERICILQKLLNTINEFDHKIGHA